MSTPQIPEKREGPEIELVFDHAYVMKPPLTTLKGRVKEVLG